MNEHVPGSQEPQEAPGGLPQEQEHAPEPTQSIPPEPTAPHISFPTAEVDYSSVPGSGRSGAGGFLGTGVSAMAADVSTNSAMFYGVETAGDAGPSGAVSGGTPAWIPATPTVYLPLMTRGNTWPESNPGRTAVDSYRWSFNSVSGYVDNQGLTRVTLAVPWWPVQAYHTWIPDLVGLPCPATSYVSGMLQPKLVTLTHVRGLNINGTNTDGDSLTNPLEIVQYGGMRCSRVTFRGSNTEYGQIIIEMTGQQPPVGGVALSSVSGVSSLIPGNPTAPGSSILVEDPYTWASWQPPNLIAHPTSNTEPLEADSWDLTIDYHQATFYGGTRIYPTRSSKTDHDVTGNINILYSQVERAAMDGHTYGYLNLGFDNQNYTAQVGLPTTYNQATWFHLPKAVYMKADADFPQYNYIFLPIQYARSNQDPTKSSVHVTATRAALTA